MYLNISSLAFSKFLTLYTKYDEFLSNSLSSSLITSSSSTVMIFFIFLSPLNIIILYFYIIKSYNIVRNRYLLSRTRINLNIIYWRERYIMYYQYPYPYQGYGYQQNNGGYGFVWGIIIVVFIIFLLFWGFGAVNKGCN